MKTISPALMTIILVFVITSTSIGTAESQTRTSMQTHHITLWQLIEALIDHP